MPSGSVTPAGGGGSLPAWLMSGSASPAAVVTPSQKGAVYVATGSGAVYVAVGTTSADWINVGGNGDTSVAGVITTLGTVYALAKGAGAGANLSDVLAQAGTGNGFYYNVNGGDGQQSAYLGLGSSGQYGHRWDADGTYTLPAPASAPTNAPQLNQLSPKTTITSGALPTVQLVTATGAQISTTRDAETITPCTFNPGAATTATVTVALSPDNVTYSTLGVETEPAGVAFDGTIHLVKVRVPAGWYLKLTVNAQAVLGLTTYY